MCYTIMFVALELVFWSFADDLLHRWKMPVYLWSNVDLRLFATRNARLLQPWR